MKLILKDTFNNRTFAESVNWEWVRSHQGNEPVKGKKDVIWILRIIDHAKNNGYKGDISITGAVRIINQNLA